VILVVAYIKIGTLNDGLDIYEEHLQATRFCVFG